MSFEKQLIRENRATLGVSFRRSSLCRSYIRAYGFLHIVPGVTINDPKRGKNGENKDTANHFCGHVVC